MLYEDEYYRILRAKKKERERETTYIKLKTSWTGSQQGCEHPFMGGGSISESS